MTKLIMFIIYNIYVSNFINKILESTKLQSMYQRPPGGVRKETEDIP